MKYTIRYIFFISFISFSILEGSRVADNDVQYLSNVYDESWAVIIGVNQYEKMKNLKYSVNDAVDVKKLLIDLYAFKEENINLIINEEATKENITKGFYRLFKTPGFNLVL